MFYSLYPHNNFIRAPKTSNELKKLVSEKKQTGCLLKYSNWLKFKIESFQKLISNTTSFKIYLAWALQNGRPALAKNDFPSRLLLQACSKDLHFIEIMDSWINKNTYLVNIQHNWNTVNAKICPMLQPIGLLLGLEIHSQYISLWSPAPNLFVIYFISVMSWVLYQLWNFQRVACGWLYGD